MLNRLEMLRIFCAAAESRNFKEAAQRLGISPQAVTRAVQALETQLGELLFHRNTRGSQVTESGQALWRTARASVDSIDGIFLRAPRDAAGEAAGLVRLAMPEALGTHLLMPELAALQRQFPGLRFAVSLSDQAAKVVDEKIDIGIYVGTLRDSRFVARTVAPVSLPIVAAPALLARVGRPATLSELEALPVTALIDPNTGRPWPWFLAGGEQWQPRQPVLLANGGLAESLAAVHGMGFAQVPSFLAMPHLADGRLVTVLDELAPPPWSVNVYRPRQGPVAIRIRVVFDWLVAYFSDPLRFPQPLAPAGTRTSVPVF